MLKVFIRVLSILGISLLLVSCEDSPCGSGVGNIKDEALCVGRTAESLKGSTEDYYSDMDYGISKNPELLRERLDAYVPGITADEAVERFARGRNNWVVWSAGNDKLWDQLSSLSFGNLDILKVISNNPNLDISDALGREDYLRRGLRWEYLGVVNEPCYVEGDKPREDRYGLWLDQWDSTKPGCEDGDPFENEVKYPGVEIGARGKNIPVGSYYGYGTGIVGLRLFPNPAFDEKAEKKWDPDKYYSDPSYYNDKDLVKPYRVGMSCGFCHVGPNPTNPPADPEAPEWANLNSNPGAQYFWVSRLFMFDPDPSNFIYQLFHTSEPGALDTSLVSSDYINNPRTMNAIYNLPARMEIASKLGGEVLKGGSNNNKQFNDYAPENSPLQNFYDNPNVLSPHVLKDGADSVGALGALNRVFVNIGLFSEEWTEHFKPIVGGKKITPFEIEVARKNSSYWNANEAQTFDTALFFLASATPDYLKDAPNGSTYLTNDFAQIDRGKEIFAETCARCHSSKLPEKAFSFFPNKGCVTGDGKGGNYLSCFGDYWDWTKTDEFKNEMKEIVRSPDFLENNFLSTEMRIPSTLLETNACSPLATNALRGNIWDNFSSESYKDLPSVGTINVQNPYTGEVSDYEMPDGGRGYTRPASLISLWSSAPYLLNNQVGEFQYSGSVDGRMASFQDGIEKMLWPEKREGNFEVVTASGKTHPGLIRRTTQQSYLEVANGYLPNGLQKLEGLLARLLPWLFDDGGVKIGPIPEGTPVNLISNINLDLVAEGSISDKAKVVDLLLKAKKDLKKLPQDATNEQANEVFKNLLDPLLDVSKCKDFVVNKGHYFGTKYLRDTDETPLSDQEKYDLIEFLKTL
jgi:hypothetical protein